MTHQTLTQLVIGSGLALAMAVSSPVQARPAASSDAQHMTDTQMGDHCRDMKAQKLKMKDDMKEQDAELNELVAKMNRAPDDKKTSLMAAIVTQIVEQRSAMDVRHAKMDDEMMQHMMQHMQMGKDSMSQCPMMKGMKEMDGMSAGAPSTHHGTQN